MLQNSIVQKFILNKLQDKLQSFFQLSQSKIQGLTIRNLIIKPDFLQQLSQIVKMPLILVSGSIDSVSLNIPWEALFSAKKDQAIAIVISGVKINAKLPTQLQRTYTIKRKNKIVEQFMQKFNKKATSRLTFLNKLKEHFLGTFCAEVKNLSVEVNIQMKHSLTATLSASYVKFQKDIKTMNHKFEIKGLSLGYRLAKQSKNEYIINQADLLMIGQKKQDMQIDNFQTNNIQISFSNQNFNDVLRLIELIKWHNSFVNIPQDLWSLKPPVIGEMPAKKKLIYICHLINYQKKQSNPKNIAKILSKRRQYIKLFEVFRKDPNNSLVKFQLNQIEQRMDVWRIKQYRNFCIEWAKKFPLQPHSNMVPKKQLADGKLSLSWLSYWFPKSGQNELKQLQNCLDNTPVPVVKKQINLNIQSIKVSVCIHSLTGKYRFLNFSSDSNSFQYIMIPIFKKQQSDKKQMSFKSCKKLTIKQINIQFDQYAGHHINHRYLMSASKFGEGNSNQEQDQFEDIQYFLQLQSTQVQTKLKILPIALKFNEDTLEKLSVFKFEKINTTFQNAETAILLQNSLQQKENEKQFSKPFIVSTSLFVTMVQSMIEKQSEKIEISLIDISYIVSQNIKNLNIQKVLVSAILRMENKDKPFQDNQNYQTVGLITTQIRMKQEVTSFKLTHLIISPIKMKIQSVQILKQLIRLISKLKPKDKQKKPLYKLKNLRRKQSIGQQFIDACENLNEHLIKSATLSEITKHQKYVLKRRKDTLLVLQIRNFTIILESSEIELSQTTIKIYGFIDHKLISISQQEKSLTLKVYNIKNFFKNISQIEKQLERTTQLKEKKQYSEKKSNDQSEENQFVLSSFGISVEVYYDNRLKIIGQLTNLYFQVMRDKNVKAEMNASLSFYQYIEKKNKQRKMIKQQKMVKDSLIEPFKINYLHEKKYNMDEKTIKISSININIKPNLFIQLGNLFDKLNEPSQIKIQIKNATINCISISTTGNRYKECKPGHKIITDKTTCDLIFFGQKESLQLTSQSGSQEIKIAQNLKMFKTFQSQYSFLIQSNLRIINRQQHPVKLSILNNRIMSQMRKNKKENAYVTLQHLSHAVTENQKQFFIQNDKHQNKAGNLKRSTSLHHRMMSNDEEDQDNKNKSFQSNDIFNFIKKQQKMKKVTETIDLKQTSSIHSLKQFEDIQKNISQRQSSNFKQQNESGSQNSNSKSQTIIHEIHPNQTIQLLSKSEDYYIELSQLGKNGETLQKYNVFKLKQILKNENQLVIHSYFFNSWNSVQQKQISSTLIIATTVTRNNSGYQIFNLEILSPVVMVNKIPMCLKFRFNKQQVDMLQIIKAAGRQIRKRSFHAIQQEQVGTFKINRINKMQYKQITQTQISVKDYHKCFRLDHIVQKLGATQQEMDIRIIDLLCLNNGVREIQMGIQIRLLKHILKITVFPQFLFLNLTAYPLQFQIKQQNYTYPPISLQPLKQNSHGSIYIKMTDDKISQEKVLQHIFQNCEQNVAIFTGSFDEEIRRSIRFGDRPNYIHSDILNNQFPSEKNKNKIRNISYGPSELKFQLRRVCIDDKPINMIMFIPPLLVINKSDWHFFLKSEGEKLKKLPKHSTQYLIINDTFLVQACEQKDEIAYNEWMKISLNTLGIIYYAKQMNSSSGYESRQYQIRKKRLKKAPKLFFRIVMTKYQYGFQILIQQSQYPPVSFINKCKSRIQVKQTTENIIQQMEQNQMAEYASRIPHHVPKFIISMVEHYQFKAYGEVSLNEPTQKILKNRIKVVVDQYKDKLIVIIEDYDASNRIKLQSMIRNDLLLERLEKLNVFISGIQVAVLNRNNKQLSCACLKGLQFNQETKNTKKFVKLIIQDAQIFSYNGIQPRHLFYSKKMLTNSKTQVFGLIKRRFNTQAVGSLKLSTSMLNTSVISSNNQNSQILQKMVPIVSLQLVVDYHKHATILQKCKVKIDEIVIVFNANTIIDYLKHYYKQVQACIGLINKHETGRNMLKKIKQIYKGQKENKFGANDVEVGREKKSGISRKNSISINAINSKYKKVSQNSTSSPSRPHKISAELSQKNPSSQEGKIDVLNQYFVIQNFAWEGLKITFKFENIQNLQYFLSNKQIKYLIKFIAWIGDLRPIQFNSATVQYQQYNILKLIELIDLNKLVRQLTQTFLQYPLQQFYHMMSFITKFAGYNDLQQKNQQWNTLKRISKRRIFSNNSSSTNYIANTDGQMTENKKYLDQFLQQNAHNEDTLQKIMRFKYQQWRYNQETMQKKLQLKPCRLQRYSPPSDLLPYEPLKARIQTAINDRCGNKIFRQIVDAYQVNREAIIGLTQDWFILYMVYKQEWIVVKHEQLLDIRMEKIKSKSKTGLNIRNIASTQYQLVLTLSNQVGKLGENSAIQKYVLTDLLVSHSEIQSIDKYVKQMRLSNVY